MNNAMILGNAPLTMSSIDLLELINAARAQEGESIVSNRHFLARIEDELDGELPLRKSFTHPSNGQVVGFYDLTHDQCKLVGMRESRGVRRWVLNRLNELEAKQARPAELSRMDILKLAMEAEQARIEAEEKLAMAAPKVEFVERFVQSSSGSKGFREVCKLLKANEAEFRAFVMDRRIMYRLGGKLTAYQCHIDAGRFEVRAGVTESEHAYTTTKFTAKGVSWIAGEWAKYQVEQQVAA